MAEQSGPPTPDTKSLLFFLDFIYVVVFADFVHQVYEKIIFANQGGQWIPFIGGWPLDRQHTYELVYSALVFFFVATDWIHARILTEAEPYKNYVRFFLDLALAFLSYGALIRAAEGHLGAALYLAAVFLGGVVWATLCLWERPTTEYRRKFRLIAFSHFFGLLAMGYFSIHFHARAKPPLDGWALGAFAASLSGFFLIEECLHAWFLPQALWLGPSGLPLTRAFILRRLEALRRLRGVLWRRVRGSRIGRLFFDARP